MSNRPEDLPPEFRDERSIPQPQIEQLQIDPPEPLPVEEVEKKPDEKIDPFLRRS